MCELTRKCKEDFEVYLRKEYNHLLFRTGDSKTYLYDLLLASSIKKTDTLLLSIIIEWFDSVDIYICIEPQKEFKNVYFDVSIDFYLHSVWSTRKEATNRAIEKANEIYNENHQKIN